jgi:hypothetical protein
VDQQQLEALMEEMTFGDKVLAVLTIFVVLMVLSMEVF